jgi:sugar lactone lactonase YvrE
MTTRSTGEITVTMAVRSTADVGEGPVWDGELGVLHWVDILAGAVHTTDLATGQPTPARPTPSSGPLFLVGKRRAFRSEPAEVLWQRPVRDSRRSVRQVN